MRTGIHVPQAVDPVPYFIDGPRVVCQGWLCREIATWARWAGRYCYDHAIRAGWLPGPVRMPGTQLGLVQ